MIEASQWDAYQEFAKGLGFIDMAAAKVHRVRAEPIVREWVAQGRHAEMHWFARGLEKRIDPRLVMEDAASVIVLITPYEKESCGLAGKKLARYACGDDYHDVLLKRLKSLCARIMEDHPSANLRPYVDTGPLLERYWAQAAGLGWIGKNGCLISRRHGSYLFLATILTNLNAPTGEDHAPFCGTCTACIDACPTNAIVADGVVDSRKCISYLNIEHRGEFPTDTPAFDDWLFGCDICQEVCPWPNKFAADSVIDAFKPRPAYESLPQQTLAEMEQVDFSTLFRKSPIKRTKMAGLKRNLAHLKIQTASEG